MDARKFQWPWQYSFPPFFTIQPNSDTRQKQLEAWCELVLGYYKSQKSYMLDVNEAYDKPLFFNQEINRNIAQYSTFPLRYWLLMHFAMRKAQLIRPNAAGQRSDCNFYWSLLILFAEIGNKTILRRRMSPEGITKVLEYLESKGNLEWIDGQKIRCLLMWRSPEEWGEMILNWAKKNGLDNSVCTLYEIHSGEEATNEEFHGIDITLLKKAIATLSKKGQAELILGEDDSGTGVKFFG